MADGRADVALVSVAGGWPGAFIAQRVFRHKSRKPSFQTGFIITVMLNCAALLWLWWMTAV